MKVRFNKNFTFLLLTFLAAFLIRLYFITRSPLIYGDDGPYYLIYTDKVMHGVETPFQSLIFYIFAFFAYIFGDITLGIKFVVSLLSALMVIPIFFLAYHITQDRRAAQFAALLAMLSSFNYNIMTQTLKEVGGLLLSVVLIYFVTVTLEKPFKRLKKEIAIIFFLALLLPLTHLFSSFYLFSFLLPYLIFVIIYAQIKKDDEKRNLSTVLLLTISISIILSLGIREILGPGLTLDIRSLTNEKMSIDLSNTKLAGTDFYSYIFFMPFVLVFLYNIFAKWKEIKAQSFLLIWLIVNFIEIQPWFVNSNWDWRFIYISYPLMITLSSVGLSVTYKWKRVPTLLLAIAILIWEAAFLIACGLVFNSVITQDEYLFLLNMRNSLPSNTVIISDCGKYHSYPCKSYWITWTGFILKEEDEIEPGDYPVLLVETKSNLSDYNYYYEKYNYTFSLSDCIHCGKIISSFGRFSFVEYRH